MSLSRIFPLVLIAGAVVACSSSDGGPGSSSTPGGPTSDTLAPSPFPAHSPAQRPVGTAPPVSGASVLPPTPAARPITVCIDGAIGPRDGGNPLFLSLCDRLPGIVKDCSAAVCYSARGFLDVEGARTALVTAADTNHDGYVDESDERTSLRLVGYSWGGVNAIEAARAFLEDGRVVQSRRLIDHVAVIDPYVPYTTATTMRVPAGVRRFWEYRHSVAPADDCSNSALLLGPYLGLRPTCDPSVACRDYDYSLATTEPFPGSLGAWRGSQIGHCTIVDPAAQAVAHNLATALEFPLAPPPATPLSR